MIPYCYLNSKQYYYLLIFLSVAICLLDVMRTLNPRFRYLCHNVFDDVLRESEKKQAFSGISYMILGFLFSYIISGHSSLYITSCLILIFADPLSGLVGSVLRTKGWRMLCFFIAACIISFNINGYEFYFYKNQIFGQYSNITGLLIASGITTLAEGYNRTLRVNDNFSIPVVYSITIKIWNYLLLQF